MKLLLISLCLILAVMAQDKYEAIEESIDMAELLSNKRLLTSYANCLLDKGRCTPELKKVKAKIPEALATHCAKCTDKQKQIAKLLAQEIKNTRPDLWKEFVALYDSEGKYQKSFKDFLGA